MSILERYPHSEKSKTRITVTTYNKIYKMIYMNHKTTTADVHDLADMRNC